MEVVRNPVGGVELVLHEVASKKVGVFKQLSTKTLLSARPTDLLFPGDLLTGRIDFTAGHDVEVTTVEVVLKCLETCKKKKAFLKQELLVKKLVTYEADNSFE